MNCNIIFRSESAIIWDYIILVERNAWGGGVGRTGPAGPGVTIMDATYICFGFLPEIKIIEISKIFELTAQQYSSNR